MSGLAVSDRGRLAELEEIVKRGLTTFVEVGEALMEIRDTRLYRDSHLTFEAYVADEFGLQRQRAYALIEASMVHAAVSEISDTAPDRESHAAALAPLLDEPDVLRDAWAEVVHLHPKPTAEQVREVVEKHRPRHGIPLDEAILARQQRENLIASLDRAICSLEGPPSMAVAEAQRLLADGDAGPFFPSRFDRVAAYASAWAQALREAGVDG